MLLPQIQHLKYKIDISYEQTVCFNSTRIPFYPKQALIVHISNIIDYLHTIEQFVTVFNCILSILFFNDKSFVKIWVRNTDER